MGHELWVSFAQRDLQYTATSGNTLQHKFHTLHSCTANATLIFGLFFDAPALFVSDALSIANVDG